ncbi:MAG TPA: VOC family protein [Dysgonamonadaceae bacterium]|jgi:catechol 2,3-dioxygenase-like lactoylglutathione lyase family enzyme|nr:VOC family protein [Dysgonamonadaceae bacterium]
MKPIIDHIQITVKDLDAAERFYDRFLPIVGFDVNKKVKVYIQEHDFYVVEYSHELLAFALTSPREAFKDEAIHRRKPGALHHLAFKADSRAEVDSAYEELKKIGANIVTKPQLYLEYSLTYYAVFFKDLENIKYEIVCNN